MAHTVPNMHQAYKEDGGEIPYDLFRDICEKYNMEAMNRVLQGETLPLGFGLATLSIVRIERDYSNPAVDWKSTMENKERLLTEEGYDEEDLYSKDNPEGIKYFIYHTDDWYARFYWQKSRCRVPNKSAYAFRATRGDKGNKTKLKKRLREEDLAHLDFKLISND